MYVRTPGYATLNLRKRPTVSSRALLAMPYGARVRATGRLIHGGDGESWYRVAYRDREGYASSSMLASRKPPPQPVAEEPTPQPAAVAGEAAPPARLLINTGAVKVSAPVEYVGETETGAMAAPVGWWNVAWYKYGPHPGEQGNSVLAGHLDSTTGPAVFWDLGELRVGDRVSVLDAAGRTIQFRVREIEVYYLGNVPMEKIFGSSDGAHLNLITCDGAFDRDAGLYDRRLVVFTDRIS
jgi:LPXTG-site transpeptidase (sortase) family protein